MKMLKDLSRYYYTMRHLKPVQILGRIWAVPKKKISAALPINLPANLKNGLKISVPFIGHDPWNRAETIRKNEFRFLNLSKKFDNGGIDWNSPDMPLLWRFNLNYFAFLYLLNKDEQIRLCSHWIRNNPRGKTAGWHSYPLSLRITNWCKQGIEEPDVLKSIYEQADYLYYNMEDYHPGNHLLENARALLMAAQTFKDFGARPAAWFRKAADILKRQLDEQILPDGGFFERTPMYHSLMLELLLDIINILPEEDINYYYIRKAAGRMGVYLKSMLHPDGQIPLFNDSTLEIAPSPARILRYLCMLTGSEPQTKTSFPQSGYYIHSGEDFFIVIDAGKIGPDNLPAHSHAGILSYELSLFSKRFIVDSGVYEYPSGEMRKFTRSTAAHNTVRIDKVDQAECWGSFRVARRYYPSGIVFRHNSEQCYFTGSFNGYSSLIGDNLIHKRQLLCDNNLRSMIVNDTVSGSGNHNAESYIHFHPDIRLQFVDKLIIASAGSIRIRLRIIKGSFRIEDGWYCPGFGVKLRNKVLVIFETGVPAEIEYVIDY
ncbi:MAG: heparinase II/III family protein [Syntrophothermus sp.]